MPSIKVLPEHISNQIAAGEVVEGPSSIIKELVENSIDAGATKIDIEVSKNFLRLQIIDNGKGMNAEDLPLAFKKHATSKIQSIDDLNKLITMGFRGEALPSISAVSKLTCTSKRAEDEHASKIYIENGQEEISLTGAANGTNIIVDDLFFNTPARLKFLKSNKKERNFIIDITRALALSHPNIAFSLNIDKRNTVRTSGSGDLQRAIEEVFSLDICKALSAVTLERGSLNINGYCSNTHVSRSDKRAIFTFVNGRAVQCYIMRSAIEAVYKELLGPGKYPIAVIKLDLPSEDVDVNVHPNKKEVKYSNTNAIYTAIGDAVSKSIADSFYDSQESFQPSLQDHALRTETEQVKISEDWTAQIEPVVEESKPIETIKSSYQPYTKDFTYVDDNATKVDANSFQFLGRLGSVDISIQNDTSLDTVLDSLGNKTVFQVVAKSEHKSVALKGDFVGENWLKEKYLEFLHVIAQNILQRELEEHNFKKNRSSNSQSRPQSKPQLKQLEEIWQRDNYTCVYCGKSLLHPQLVKESLALVTEPELINDHLASYDHHLPASKHPELNQDSRNLYACCQSCNKLKSDSLAHKTWTPDVSDSWQNYSKQNPLKIAGLDFFEPR